MAEDQFQKFMARMDEIWAHKEAVASNVLGDLGKKIHKVGADVDNLRTDVGNLERALDDAVKEVHSSMKLKHQELEYENKDHDRRLSLMEKIVLGVASAIGLAIIGAGMAVILR